PSLRGHMRLASYVPGELIPLPLSGSIPELPHVAKVENRVPPKKLREGRWKLSTRQNKSPLGSCFTFISATGWTMYCAGAATGEGADKSPIPKNERPKMTTHRPPG